MKRYIQYDLRSSEVTETTFCSTVLEQEEQQREKGVKKK